MSAPSKSGVTKNVYPIEFIGGSRDGDAIEATSAPDHHEVSVREDVVEIYERQNEQPPFVYLQIGYAGNVTWQ